MFTRNEKQENVRIRKRKFLCFFMAVMVALSSLSPAIAWAAKTVVPIDEEHKPADLDEFEIIYPGDIIDYSNESKTDNLYEGIQYYNANGKKVGTLIGPN
ncbi:MAG: hypothetical protein K5668_10380, partial [Lachnospiraceae bacterium]|nr:hypothetical protein [Lachnospiraceae bacterium]